MTLYVNEEIPVLELFVSRAFDQVQRNLAGGLWTLDLWEGDLLGLPD